MNVLLSMCADIGILTGLFFGIQFMAKAKLPDGAILTLLFAGLAALSWVSYAALVRFAEKRYREIET